jgi:hypothetical protein
MYPVLSSLIYKGYLCKTSRCRASIFHNSWLETRSCSLACRSWRLS